MTQDTTRRRRPRRAAGGRKASSVDGLGNDDFKFGTDLEGMKQQYNVQEKIEVRLKAAGLGNVAPPTIQDHGEEHVYRGEIPSDLDQLSDSEVGKYLSATTRWFEYLGRLLGRAEIELETRKTVRDRTRSFLRRSIEEERKEASPSGKKYLDDDQVSTNPLFIEVDAAYLEAEGYHRFIKRAYEAAENNRRAISRQYNIREGEGGPSSREETVNRRRQGTFRQRKRS